MNIINEQKRLDDINNILKHYSEPDVPTSIVKNLKKKFPEIKDYTLVKAEQIYEGMELSLIPLDMSELHIPGRCVKIFYRKNNSISSIKLYNSDLKIYWKINPKKYYLFKILSQTEIYIKEFLKDYKRKNFKE
jgi:hypothetical protein